ncbi:MAG: 23S rRNA (guanosine2251-2'-O)-methyltransferase [Pseudohongiellaceae bacterium]|jgi:23S rRNA (guanosine2251-2'-O)-methyltransferase
MAAPMAQSEKKTDRQTVYGFHAVEALLKNPKNTITTLYLLSGRTDKRLNSLQKLASQAITIEWVARDVLDTMVDANHQGVVAQIASISESYDEGYLKSHLPKLIDAGIQPFILVLDGITDPHNLGACLRSAEAAGVQFVVVPKDNSAPLNAVVSKVACGAAEVIPLIRVTNLSRTLQWLQQQGVWILGAAGEAEQHHFQADLKGPLAIVMGSEGKGLRRLTREYCDGLMRIPMVGSVSSLNVSVATGVCLFEALRQRQ